MTNGAQQQPAGYTGLATQWASVVDHALEVWTTSASSCWQSKGLGAPADFAPLTAWNNYVNELAQLFTGWTSLYRLGGPPGQAAATGVGRFLAFYRFLADQKGIGRRLVLLNDSPRASEGQSGDRRGQGGATEQTQHVSPRGHRGTTGREWPAPTLHRGLMIGCE